MFFDTHAHYDDEQFDSDREELLTELPAQGVEMVVNPGIDMASSLTAIEFSRRYDYIYAACGFHPHELGKWEPGTIDKLETLCQEKKVVAIGEIGLDYHYDLEFKELQLEKFREQMALARKLKMPVIIHDRDAHGDCMEIVREFPDVKGVFHCYSGSREMAKELLNMGWYLSFTGAITFKGARKAVETIEMMPFDRIMIETDSPYLAPVPNRGKRNSSLNLLHIAAKIAEIKGLSTEDIGKITTENGKRFFGINR